MKLRVLGVLSLLCVLMVVMVSNAVLTSVSRELTQELQINRVAALNRFAQVAYDTALDVDSSQLQSEMDRYSALYGEGVLIRLQQATLRSGGLNEKRADVRDAVSRAKLNLSDTALAPLQPFGTGTVVVSRSFGNANQVLGEVVLEVNLDGARQKLRERWFVVGLAALALGALLLLSADCVTRWVLRPVQRLNSAVTELQTRGRTGQLPEDGPPELRELSRSFSAMARTISKSIDSQRQLIADTSHQLRNPVGALRLRVDLLQLNLQTTGEQGAAAEVLTELERVEVILDGVLKLAAAEHRAFEDSARGALVPDSRVNEVLIDPFPVLQEEIERAGPAALRAGASIVLGRKPDPPLHIACTDGEFAHMVGELLTNAIKYAPRALISVAIHGTAGVVALTIEDDGPGLSAAETAAATTRFWRSPQHRQIRGNGLGMTIVDKLAGANGARLLLTGVSPHGLRARIEFPCSAIPAPQEPDA